MTQPNVAAGFEVWGDEAKAIERAQSSDWGYSVLDSQVPIIALVGVYTVLTSDVALKTSYAWRQTILSSEPTRQSLRAILPPMEQEDIDDTYSEQLDVFKMVPRGNESQQYICTSAAVVDGLPDEAISIPANERYLAHVLGQAIHNYAVNLRPLRLAMSHARSPLQIWFPRTLVLIESNQS